MELVVTEQRGGYRIALSHTAERSDACSSRPRRRTRYRVIEVTAAAAARCRRSWASKGLSVPKNARERVIALVQRDNPSLPIRAEIDAVEADGLDGVATPVVQLVP